MEKDVWTKIHKIVMRVVATRVLGSGELIFGVAEIEKEEFLLLEENKEGNCLLLIPKERIVDDISDVISHSENYKLCQDEKGHFLCLNFPDSLGWSSVWE